MVNISIYLQRVSPSSSSVPSSPPLTSSTVNPSTSSYQSTIVAAREVLRSTAERTKDLADEARVITDRTREALHLGGGDGGDTPAVVKNVPSSQQLPPSPPAPIIVPGSNPKNLVIGMASGISDAQLSVFVRSLRLHSKPTQTCVVLFFDEVTDLAREIMKEHDVEGVVFDKSNHGEVHPSTYRWPMISDYITRNRRLISGVLMADVRDMSFQSDPFSVLSTDGPGLHTFNGVEHIEIGKDGWNGGWVKDCFGEAKLHEIGHNVIVCSGATIGDVANVVMYLDNMVSAMSTPEFLKCERNGVDQGVHNVLVHDGTLERNGVKVLRHNQRQGTVANMQAGVAKFRGGKVVNGEGRTVDVVHQYDRDEGLQDMLFKTFVDWDMSEVHEGTGACSGYKIKENTEPYKGRCDLSHDGGSDYMECCEVCNSKPSCKGFTHIRKGCWLKTCGKGSAPELKVVGATGAWKAD